MHRFLLVVSFVSFVSLPLFAQDTGLAAVRAVGPRVAATANCGLQEATDGRGLLGGGRDYRVHFDAGGARYEAALGPDEPATRFVHFAAQSVRRGAHSLAALPSGVAPVASGTRVTYAHAAGISERYDVRADGVAVSWEVRERPAGGGDLVVRYTLASNLAAPVAHGDGLRLLGTVGGVQIGGVLGIDAQGRSAPGRLAWVDDGLELSLPAAFVDGAAYPLVLDPVVGTVIPISSGLTYTDGEPDAAYDSSGRFLIVWRRTFSATNSDVRGQRLWSTGQLLGTTIFFASAGTVSPPRVADLGGNSRFGVVWSQLVGGTSSVMFQAMEVTAGALDAAVVLDTTTTSVHGPADIGTDPEATPGQTRGACVVWEDEDFDAIRVQRLYYNSGGAHVLPGQFALFLDGVLGPNYSEPAISRAAGPDGWLLVAVRRRSPLTTSSAIEARMIKVDGSLTGIAGTVATSTDDNLFAPDVDGYAGRWVVAHERRSVGGGTYDAVAVTPVTDAGFTQIAVGPSATLGGSPLTRALFPTVGYAVGRTWIGYRQTFTLPSPGTSLRIAAFDTATCTNCNDAWTAPNQGGDRIVVATTVSGGVTFREFAFAVWHASFDDIEAQEVEHHGTTGTTTSLGGGCGNAGSVVFNHEPGIGSSSFQCTLQNVPPTALATIFNFAPAGAPLSCGACVWTPFSVTLSPPLLGTYASVDFPIPCLPALVGSQFETQWTNIDFAQAPCALFPGIVLSNRTLLTIGQ